MTRYPITAEGVINATVEEFFQNSKSWQTHLFLDGKTTYHIQPFDPRVSFSSGVCGEIFYDGFGILEYIYTYSPEVDCCGRPPRIVKSDKNWLYRVDFKEGKLPVNHSDGFDIDLRNLLVGDYTVGYLTKKGMKLRSVDADFESSKNR